MILSQIFETITVFSWVLVYNWCSLRQFQVLPIFPGSTSTISQDYAMAYTFLCNCFIGNGSIFHMCPRPAPDNTSSSFILCNTRYKSHNSRLQTLQLYNWPIYKLYTFVIIRKNRSVLKNHKKDSYTHIISEQLLSVSSMFSSNIYVLFKTFPTFPVLSLLWSQQIFLGIIFDNRLHPLPIQNRTAPQRF